MSTKLIEKVALVTGAGHGIGRAIALALAVNGAHVPVNFRSRQAEAERFGHRSRPWVNVA